MFRVGLYFYVQTVVTKKEDALTAVDRVPDELGGIAQPGAAASAHQRDAVRILDRIVGDISVTAGLQRNRPIEKVDRIPDYCRTASRIVVSARFLAVVFRDDIRTVQGVIQTAPARVCRIQCKSCIADRYHQLRPGDPGNLRIDILCRDFTGFAGLLEITDRLQELDIFVMIPAATGPGLVPAVDFRLQFVTKVEQRAIAVREFGDQGLEPAPEFIGRKSDDRQQLFFDERVKNRVNRETADLSVIRRRHRQSLRSGQATNCSSSVLPSRAVVDERPSMIVF